MKSWRKPPGAQMATRPLGRFVFALAILSLGATDPSEILGAPFELRDGDRVVWVGATTIEREQSHGYWELALTTRFPRANIRFRDLGWSGDNVWGESRAGFGQIADGFEELLKQVDAIDPTVVFVAYGANESQAGEVGLPRFRAGLSTMLDALAKEGRRLVLVSPAAWEKIARPTPDPEKRNAKLKLYAEAIGELAEEREAPFVDLFEFTRRAQNAPRSSTEPSGSTGQKEVLRSPSWTDNGLHYNAFGYWITSTILLESLGWPEASSTLELPTDSNRKPAANVTKLESLSGSLRYRVTLAHLPLPPPLPTLPPSSTKKVGAAPHGAPRVIAAGLAPGKYALRIDDEIVAVLNAEEWRRGWTMAAGPDLVQAEAARLAIVEKNRLCFCRWRPQNVTYLFGFRQHEQGNNAGEVERFEPLIEARETEIATLRAPRARVYELRRVDRPIP